MTSSRTATYMYAVIGAGPAGLQLGYYLQQAGHSYVILEGASQCGSFFQKYPRHRTLISINKVYTGYADRERQLRWDWNSLLGPEGDPSFAEYSKEYFPPARELVHYLNDYADRHRIHVQTNTEVRHVRRTADGLFELEDQRGTLITAEKVVVAAGFTRPNIPRVEGIEHAIPYTDMVVDPMEYRDERVLIIGKGNSAFETADALIPTTRMIHMISPKPVEFAWRSHFVGHLRAVNNNFLDTYQLKAQNAVLDADILWIRKVGSTCEVRVRYIHNDETEILTYDRVLNCAGFRFDDSIFEESARPQMRHCGRLPLMTECWESDNQENLFFAGTLTQVRDYKRSSSSFIHGFRYNSRALFRYLEHRFHQKPWPQAALGATASELAGAMLERINHSSGLWQQFGFLCDVISESTDGYWSCRQEIPLDLVQSILPATSRYFAVTLEYGTKKMVDPFNQRGRVVRDDVERGDQSAFLHPVVRYYESGELVATHHVIEDLAAEWTEPEHLQPLMAFVADQLHEKPLHSEVRGLQLPAAIYDAS